MSDTPPPVPRIFMECPPTAVALGIVSQKSIDFGYGADKLAVDAPLVPKWAVEPAGMPDSTERPTLASKRLNGFMVSWILFELASGFTETPASRFPLFERVK